eukprot:403361829
MYQIIIFILQLLQQQSLCLSIYEIKMGGLCSAPQLLGGSSWRPDFPISSLERTIVDRDMSLGLYNLRYDHFERTIKRFGYKGKLEENILEQIGQEINISLKEIQNDQSLHNFFFKNTHIFQQGIYNPEELLIIGFLLTIHESASQAADSLWGIMNPDMEDDVEEKRVQYILQRLVYYSVDVHLEYQLKMASKNGEIEEYLRDIDDRKSSGVDEIMRKLDKTVTRKDLIRAISGQLYSSYKVRCFIHPVKAKALND